MGKTHQAPSPDSGDPLPGPETRVSSESDSQAPPGPNQEIIESKCHQIIERFESTHVDEEAVRQYLELDATSATQRAALLLAGSPLSISAAVETSIQLQNEVTEALSQERAKRANSMNLVTLRSLGGKLGYDEPIQDALDDSYFARFQDTVRKPVLLAIRELFEQAVPLFEQAEETVSVAWQEVKSAKNLRKPKLPCSLIRALRFASNAGNSFKPEYLIEEFKRFLSTNLEIPMGEISDIVFFVRSNSPLLGGADLTSPRKKNSDDTNKRDDLLKLVWEATKPVTERNTLLWLRATFGQFWQERLQEHEEARSEKLIERHAVIKGAKKAAAAFNSSKADKKWNTVTLGWIEFIRYKRKTTSWKYPDTIEGRNELLLEFARDANKYTQAVDASAPKIAVSRSEQKQRIRDVLCTLMDHPIEGTTDDLQELITECGVKSLSDSTTHKCLEYLRGAGLSKCIE